MGGVLGYNQSPVHLPFLSSCHVDFTTDYLENHCMYSETQLSRHRIWICFSILIALITDLRYFTARFALAPGNIRTVCWVPKANQPAVKDVSNIDAYFLETFKVTKKDFEKHRKKKKINPTKTRNYFPIWKYLKIPVWFISTYGDWCCSQTVWSLMHSHYFIKKCTYHRHR